MAAYQGARPRPALSVRAAVAPRTGLAPRASSAGAADVAGTLPRRRIRSGGAIRAGRRSNRIGILLGAIVVAFLLAFFSLAQTMRVSATAYELDRLAIQRDRLESQERELRSDVNRLGSEPAIRKQALDLGLGQLGSPVVVDAR
jgi:cell division protein FtsL